MLWLVRHAATDWNGKARFQGHTDVPLNEEGRAQARSLAEALRDRRFDGIWSSPLARAVETAVIAVGEPAIDVRLIEFDFGALEGKTWTDCSVEVQEALLAFDDFAAPGGESVPELRERVHSFIRDLPPGDHVVFTHGGVIHALLRETGEDRDLPPASVVPWEVPGSGAGSTERS